MEALEKLRILSQAGDVEAGEDGCRQYTAHKRDGIVLTRAVMSNGRSTTLLKTLLTSVCEHNCLYCPFRSGRDFPRMSFDPDEFARLAVNLTRAGLIQGVFLSSGVAGGGPRTQDRLLATAEILRRKLGFSGYLHLKIMPGAEFDQVLHAMQLADRVSINLEAPNADRLPKLAPEKDFEKHLLEPLRWMETIRREAHPYDAWKNRWPSSCTQFVVGGADESDRELLQTTQVLHRDYGVLRAYFSAFQPHMDTSLEDHLPVSYQREHRLYQADYLIRDYGFSKDELIYDSTGNLLAECDPKLAWAQMHLVGHPVEINKAKQDELLRVPGIGPKGAKTIIKNRLTQQIRELGLLSKWGIQVQRAKDFILLDGREPDRQMRLF